jgi:hypothetical protein
MYRASFIIFIITNNAELIQGDQKVSVHLMITIQKVTWLHLTAWQPTARARGKLDLH